VTSPLRLERALRLMPAVEALEPLRMLLMAASETDDARKWSSAGMYLTVGKRSVNVDTLRGQLDQLMPRITDHVTRLYEAYITALAAQHAGDGAAAAHALARAADEEAGVRRLPQARAWLEVAFRVATELNDRGPEIEILNRLGETDLALGRPMDASRFFQRMLVLAEAGFDHDNVIRACHGLGRAALARRQYEGARAWCLRALRHAAGGSHALHTVQLERTMALTSWRQGFKDEALERLAVAITTAESLDAPAEMALLLKTRGEVQASTGAAEEALASLRESGAWLRRAPDDPALRTDLHLALADAFELARNPVEAERELRSAEQVAIEGRLTDRLVDVYLALGRLSGTRRDETGFVFFEQAIELAHIMGWNLALEGHVFEEYGRFRHQLGSRDEAQAHFERAARSFEASGDSAAAERLRTETASATA